jgi:GTPase
VTQLKWRLQEGLGEAIYEIGVEDNGLLAGLTREDLNMSLDTLKRMAGKLGSETTVLREQVVDGCEGEDSARIVAEVLVRKVSDDQQVSTYNYFMASIFRLPVPNIQDIKKTVLMA